MRPKLLAFLTQKYGIEVSAEDLVAYIAATAAHPAFTARFQDDLSTPGLRIPLTAERDTFAEAVELGRTIIWLHTFGERMADPAKGRPAQPPRLPAARRPTIPKDGAIPQDPAAMPDTINYDVNKKRLLIGTGYVENVPPGVWSYEVSGKQVLLQWFSYRKAKPGAPHHRRPPPALTPGQHPARPLARRIHDRTDQRPQRARLPRRSRARPSHSAGEDLLRPDPHGRRVARGGSL